MPEAIYVLLDHGEGKIKNTSLEALSLGQNMTEELGFSLHAVILGKEVDALVEEISDKRLDSILVVRDDKLKDYDPDLHCEALKQILSQDQPQLLLMGHIYQNIDLAPKLSATLNRALVTDCVGYRLEDDNFIFVRQMFRNKINADVRITSDSPWIVTTQAGLCSLDTLQKGQAQTVDRTVDLSGVQTRRNTLEAFEAVKGKVDLSKAEVIVAVGRGIKKEANIKILEELAEVLGAEIGASRPVVDNEWVGRDRQIGSSGQTVSPRLYLACGISGAIQHIVGMKNADCIVAINTDPNAPIFNIATYGVVGDLMEVIPILTRKLKEDRDG